MHAEIDHFIDPLISVQGLLWQALLTAALVAVAALITVQVIKAPIRWAFHYVMTTRWLSYRESKVKEYKNERRLPPSWLREIGDYGTPYAELSFPSLSSLMPFVPMDLYLKKLQNVAQRALEHPAEHEPAFAYFAADAAISDMVVAYHVDAMVRYDPRLLDRLTASEGVFSGGDKSLAAAVAAAQDNVSTSIERSLDDLQIRLMFWWPITMRIVVVLAAIALSGLFFYSDASGARWTSADVLLVLIMGAAAGYLASFIYDTLSLFAAFRPRPQ
jgi:hypothetical protein